jgi:uncharacterized protein (TIGR00297 family)
MDITLWAYVSVLAVIFCWTTVRLRWLDLSGALAASALGVEVVFCAGLVWLVPLFFFFGSSTLIGKLLRRRQPISDTKQGKPRDAWQVLCNGLVYGLCAAFVPLGAEPIGHAGMLISMAVATADTWSSEIGTAVRGTTWDVLRGHRVPPGLSGGISLAGTLGGGLGAGCLVASMQIIGWIGHSSYILDAKEAFGVTLIGVLGMLMDSALGSGWQARYVGEDGQLSDSGQHLKAGHRWMTNDMVNLLSNAITTFLAVAFLNNAYCAYSFPFSA